MNSIFMYLEQVSDSRQQKKVLHKMSDIIAIVFFALLANADEWTEIYYFAITHEKLLWKYLELPNGVPSHDTIQRVFAMVSPEFLQQFQILWNESLSSGEGERIKKILALDGKTQRGNGTFRQKANHIVSAVDEDGFCLGQKRVGEKTNEITAIPDLLDSLNIRGHIITTDAMGTQTEIVKKIRKKHADYVLALKSLFNSPVFAPFRPIYHSASSAPTCRITPLCGVGASLHNEKSPRKSIKSELLNRL